MNPEFLRQVSANQDFLEPWLTVFGTFGETEAAILGEMYAPFNAPIVAVDCTSAEVIKYANNLYNATKISFFNEFHLVCERLGIDSEVIGRTVAHSAESMWNPSYGTRGGWPYGGACLPKDTAAFYEFAHGKLGMEMPVLAGTMRVNEMLESRISAPASMHEVVPTEVLVSRPRSRPASRPASRSAGRSAPSSPPPRSRSSCWPTRRWTPSRPPTSSYPTSSPPGSREAPGGRWRQQRVRRGSNRITLARIPSGEPLARRAPSFIIPVTIGMALGAVAVIVALGGQRGTFAPLWHALDEQVAGTPIYVPLGVFGLVRWAFWLSRKIPAAFYRPITAPYTTSSAIITPVYKETPSSSGGRSSRGG
jgi:hypothetical protein